MQWLHTRLWLQMEGATSHWTKLHQSLSTTTCANSELCPVKSPDNTFTKWLSFILTKEILIILICMIKVKHSGKRWVAIRLYLRYISVMWLIVLRYVWTKPFTLLAQHSLGFLSDSPRFNPGFIPAHDCQAGVTWGHSPWCQATGVQPGLPQPAQTRPWGWGWLLWCQQENQKSGSPRLQPAYTERCRIQSLFLCGGKNQGQEEVKGREEGEIC